MSKKAAPVIIISVGTELTAGIIQDTHGQYISELSESLGFTVSGIFLLPDIHRAVCEQIRRALDECDILIITGGLGPTSDDITREALSEAVERKLIFSDEVWKALTVFYRGKNPPESNKKQAMIPEGFTIIQNRNGTAPGFWGEAAGNKIIVLPGPPKELKPMFQNQVVPLLRQWGGGRKKEVLWGTSVCISESKLEMLLKENSEKGVIWGTRIEPLRIVFHISGQRRDILEKVMNRLIQKTGELCIHKGLYDPVADLFSLLKTRKSTFAGAESCTGGLVAKLITDIPGSSAVFWGGYTVYSNEAKIKLGVDPDILCKHGAVSQPVVERLAASVLKISGADAGFAVSGIAGPDGGTPDKPVGTVWIAVDAKNGRKFSRCFQFPGSRDAVRRKTAAAVFLLLFALAEREELLDSEEIWAYI